MSKPRINATPVLWAEQLDYVDRRKIDEIREVYNGDLASAWGGGSFVNASRFGAHREISWWAPVGQPTTG